MDIQNMKTTVILQFKWDFTTPSNVTQIWMNIRSYNQMTIYMYLHSMLPLTSKLRLKCHTMDLPFIYLTNFIYLFILF